MTMPDEDRVPGSNLDPDERDLEAPPEDAVEQARPANPGLEVPEPHRGNDVNEWDAVEQARVVDLDDDYR
jgi:actin-related protein